MKKKEYKSLAICGYCGKDTSNDPYGDRTEKIIMSGYADMLCESCRYSLENEIIKIARKYLDNEI